MAKMFFYQPLEIAIRDIISAGGKHSREGGKHSPHDGKHSPHGGKHIPK